MRYESKSKKNERNAPAKNTNLHVGRRSFSGRSVVEDQPGHVQHTSYAADAAATPSMMSEAVWWCASWMKKMTRSWDRP